VPITSRTRGGVSGAHAISATLALEMAGGIIPPPLALITRNLGACGEVIADSVRHLFLFAGPDYAEPVVRRSNPALWQRAESTRAAHTPAHGYVTIADLMRSLSPLSGELSLEALQINRLASEISTLVYGKSPHPSTIIPGGNGVDGSRELFTLILGRINTLLDYAKLAVAVWDDLIDFLYEAEPQFQRLGELPANLISAGLWDDPDSYTATYSTCNEWGLRRLSGPGVIINGEKRTSRLTDLNIGLEEFVERTHFALWERERFTSDPLDNPISPFHPWNKETVLAEPRGQANPEGMSWLTALRWDRESMECGALARLWINSVFRHQNCEFIIPVRHGLEINLPKGNQPAKRLSWYKPEKPNALERLRATAYQIGYAGMVAYASLLSAFECLRRGETRMSNRFILPDRSLGVGFWENGSGLVTHHLIVRNHTITNYQINGPAEWMASSHDPFGRPGTIEQALLNSPLMEVTGPIEEYRGVDLQRVVRSFAP
ncbi:MAG: nickel-dependent hydrogenase large subunit, partial [Acidobacteriota bacterium]